jgi:hypothetical protein
MGWEYCPGFMRRTLSVSFALSILVCASGSEAEAQGVVCSLSPVMPSYSPLADQPPTVRAAKDLKTLVALLCPKGCGRVSLFQNVTIPNALVVTSPNGSSRIEYSPAFLERIRELFGADARFGVLAHEFGHHIDVNSAAPTWIDPSWDAELRADAWAGCALAKAGLKTQGLKDALRAVSAYSSRTDPAKTDLAWEQRWLAMQQGHDACGSGAGMKMAALDGQAKAGASLGSGGPGCMANAECRMGRVCLEGRCAQKSARDACVRDIDCPDGQICTVGRCDKPAGSGQFVSAAAFASQPKPPARACRRECGVERRECRVGAMSSLKQCLSAITLDSKYKDCSCPSWAAAKPECRQVCEDAFDKADQCESEYAPGKDACLAEAPACRDCR